MSTTSISHYFGQVNDPRQTNSRHPLMSIISITIMAVLCNAEGWADVELFGQSKEKWLSTFLDLPHGIPSHDTFGRVFRAIDPDEFGKAFSEWTQAICDRVTGVVAIDGKTLRGSKDGILGKRALHMVNVWAVENGLVLAQQKVAAKTNEITVIPQLLELLDIEGTTVTVDAMGCQTDIAQAILDEGADYVLAVKGNQDTLLDDIMTGFEQGFAADTVDYHRTVDKGHGRIETRECWVSDDPALIDYISDYKGWPGLRSVVKVSSQRRRQDDVTTQTRYFITSLPPLASSLLAAVRDHWQIENSLHWVLDMTFQEDASRVRKDYAPQNLALLRKLTLNLLKQDTSIKASLKGKRKRAGWDHDYLLSLLCT